MTGRSLSREEVLSAIREMTAELGRPPGRRAFLARHRVPASAFQGMYWARWTDAVRDAGIVPLDPPDPISEGFILESLAGITRRLGRYPSQAEMRILKQTEPEFPGVPAIVKRLGTRPEQTRRLIAWSRSTPGFADVADMLGADGKDARVEGDFSELNGADGYVYLLQSGRYFKIGMTTSVPRRWAEIAGAAPEQVELVHYFKTDDPAGIEAYWHRRFAPQRQGGEWFELGARDVAAFRKRVKFM